MLEWTLKLIPGVIVDLISEFAGRVDSKQMSRVCSAWHRCLAWRYVSVSRDAVHDCGLRYVLHAIYNEVENRTHQIHITRDRLTNWGSADLWSPDHQRDLGITIRDLLARANRLREFVFNINGFSTGHQALSIGIGGMHIYQQASKPHTRKSPEDLVSFCLCMLCVLCRSSLRV